MTVLEAPEAFRFEFIALSMRYNPMASIAKEFVFSLTLTFRRRHVLHPVDLNGMPPIFMNRGLKSFQVPRAAEAKEVSQIRI